MEGRLLLGKRGLLYCQDEDDGRHGQVPKDGRPQHQGSGYQRGQANFNQACSWFM